MTHRNCGRPVSIPDHRKKSMPSVTAVSFLPFSAYPVSYLLLLPEVELFWLF